MKLTGWMGTGMTKEEVEAAHVRLTYDGAAWLNACHAARGFWRDVCAHKTFTVDAALAQRFDRYGVRAFILRIYRRLKPALCGEIDIAFVYDVETRQLYQRVDDTQRRANKSLSTLNPPSTALSLKKTALHLKAAVILACKLEEAGRINSKLPHK
jgi:hypothetical protein